MTIFLLRVILSIFIGFLIGRFFFEKMVMYKVFGLAAVLLGLAYLLEYFRKRNAKVLEYKKWKGFPKFKSGGNLNKNQTYTKFLCKSMNKVFKIQVERMS